MALPSVRSRMPLLAVALRSMTAPGLSVDQRAHVPPPLPPRAGFPQPARTPERHEGRFERLCAHECGIAGPRQIHAHMAMPATDVQDQPHSTDLPYQPGNDDVLSFRPYKGAEKLKDKVSWRRWRLSFQPAW